MTARLSTIWRHPIKGHGRETLDSVTLTAGRTLPGDRVWAVAHEASKAGNYVWAPCTNFSRGAKAPALQAIRSAYDDATGRVTLTHPDRPPLNLDPETEGARLVDWVRPLMPENRAQSARLVCVPGRGMTDTDFPSISLLNSASNAEVAGRAGQDVSPERWRGNLLVDGLAPWAEWEWIGRDIRIGEAVLTVRERITRCNATKANTDTGVVDIDTLGTLQDGWGHQDFGIYLTVTEGGRIAAGDPVELLDTPQ